MNKKSLKKIRDDYGFFGKNKTSGGKKRGYDGGRHFRSDSVLHFRCEYAQAPQRGW